MGLWGAPWSTSSTEINALGEWDLLETPLGALTNVPPGAEFSPETSRIVKFLHHLHGPGRHLSLWSMLPWAGPTCSSPRDAFGWHFGRGRQENSGLT